MNLNISDEFKKLDQVDWLRFSKESLKLNSSEELEKLLNFKSIENINISAVNFDQDISHNLTTFPDSILLARFTSKLSQADQLGGVNFAISEESNPEGITLIRSIHTKIEVDEINLDIFSIYLELNEDKEKLLEFISSIKAKIYPYINTSIIHNAGGSILHEVAMMLNLIEFTRDFCHLKNPLFIEVSIDSLFFTSISKLRAIRYFLEMINEDIEKIDFEIIAKNSYREQTRLDPWMNMLRNTASCAAGIIGGANTMAISSYDDLLESEPSSLGLRQSRNIFHILMSESFLNKVQDASYGSYAIEKLTKEIITHSLDLFNHFEKDGGMLNHLDQIDMMVDELFQKRVERVNHMKHQLVGVNNFANIDEFMKEQIKETNTWNILKPKRLSGHYEALRSSVMDKNLDLLIVSYGEDSKLTARLMFCANYFEVLGHKIESIKIETEADLKKIKHKNILLCAEDSSYEDLLAFDFSKFSNLFLAGNKIKDDRFQNIYSGQNQFQVLSKFTEENHFENL